MDENKNKSNSTLKKDEKIREHDMTFIEYIKMKSKDKLTIDGEVGIKTRELAQAQSTERLHNSHMRSFVLIRI